MPTQPESSSSDALHEAAPSSEAQAVARELLSKPFYAGEGFDEMREHLEEAGSARALAAGTEVTAVEEETWDGEWVRARGAAAKRAVLYLHGGGYCLGSPASHRSGRAPTRARRRS